MLFAQAPRPSCETPVYTGWSDPFAGSAISTSVGGGKGHCWRALMRGLPPGSWPPAREKEMGSVGEGVDWAAAPNGANS